MASSKNSLILSIDLDEWFHCRWATGGPDARWHSIADCLNELYGAEKPAGDIIRPTRWILEALNSAGARATFFVLGEVAQWYPELIGEIAASGHEIACHGMHHRDLTSMSRDTFANELAEARETLRSLSGQSVDGFRAPNLMIPSWLKDVLVEQGFRYDSSVCASREIQGKFAGQRQAPRNPYRVSKSNLLEKGDENLVEIPIPVFPLLRLPGAVSIATRIFGWRWTSITLETALRTGATCYYMHPYEFNAKPRVSGLRLRDQLFLRRVGPYMYDVMKKLLRTYEGRIVAAEDFVESTFPKLTNVS